MIGVFVSTEPAETGRENVKSPRELQAIVSCKMWFLGAEFGFFVSTAKVCNY